MTDKRTEKSEAVPSVLYDEHIALGAKSHMAEFAGYLMPLWYSSAGEEHAAVRQSAGMFDCTHMGVLEVSGEQAEGFLNMVSTNDVGLLKVGAAQYSYILDTSGSVVDDIIIYKRADDNFMLVVNAANEPNVKAYFSALVSDTDADSSDTVRKLEYMPEIRDMRDARTPGEHLVDIALQGPASIEILSDLMAAQAKDRIKNLRSFHFIEATLAGIKCLISKTGYTGAKTGFEIFVDLEKAVQLWRAILEAGTRYDILPCGLAARDSLRIEAGLPLYGHELAGKYNLSPYEAGYGWAVKLEKDFFIGKKEMEGRNADFAMEVCRMSFSGEKGVRPVRADDAIVDSEGKCIGWVLSSAKGGEAQIALALVERGRVSEGESAGLYYLARNERQAAEGRHKGVERGNRVRADISGKVLSRFERF